MAKFADKLQNAAEVTALTPSALTFLSDLGSEERAAFREVWPRFPLERRRQIVEMLASMSEDNIELFFRPVFLVALDDIDARVRLSAIEGLFEDNSKLLLGKLIDILGRDPDTDVREAAAKALGRFAYLAQCDKLGVDAPRLRDALVSAATDGDEEIDVRRRATEAVGYLTGDDEILRLIGDAYRRGGRYAESALFAMGRNMDPRWEQIVMTELESDRPAMRYEAARAAGEMALEDALPFLVRLTNDKDLEVKLAAVWALGQVGGKPAAEALARALKSEDLAVRDAAREALEEIAFSANPLNVY